MAESKLAKQQAEKAEKALATQTAAAKSVSPAPVRAVKKAAPEKEPELYVSSKENSICTCIARDKRSTITSVMANRIEEIDKKLCTVDCKGTGLSEDKKAELVTERNDLNGAYKWIEDSVPGCK
jgi:hypothetical protein